MINKLCKMLCMIYTVGVVNFALAQVPMDVSPPASIDLTEPGGRMWTIRVRVTNNNTSIDAYALKLTYPTTLLSFVKTDSAGTATDGWVNSGGSENVAGEVTIGGFTAQGSGFTQDDTLINVIFMDTGVQGNGLIELTQFDDDIKNATTTDGILNSSVPVELVSFSAEVAAGEVTLSWLTASEDNNFGFEIQKSLDEENFSKIGFVPGNGTTVLPNQYSFSDNELDPAEPLRYYRLKQIDLDGSFTLSGVLTVSLSLPERFSLEQNYPNPFNPETTISYELPNAMPVTLEIYNLQGQVIRSLVDQEMPAGFHSIIWNGQDNRGNQVASNMYIYKMRAGDVTRVKTLTLLK